MIRLEPVTRHNWKEALKLTARDDQQDFVPTVAVSLAKVHIRPDGDNYTYSPFAINNIDGEMVGFVMLTYAASTDETCWFNGLIIDENHQGKGYGRATLDALVHYAGENFPRCRHLNLTVCENNARARDLYERYGFTATGDVYDGEIVYTFTLKNGASSEAARHRLPEPQFEVVDVKERTRHIHEYTNFIVSEVNDHVVRAAVLDGEFHWHKHEDCDEMFMVIEGELFIDLEDRTVALLPLQMFTVKRNVMHRTRSSKRTVNLCFERADNDINGI